MRAAILLMIIVAAMTASAHNSRTKSAGFPPFIIAAVGNCEDYYVFNSTSLEKVATISAMVPPVQRTAETPGSYVAALDDFSVGYGLGGYEGSDNDASVQVLKEGKVADVITIPNSADINPDHSVINPADTSEILWARSIPIQVGSVNIETKEYQVLFEPDPMDVAWASSIIAAPKGSTDVQLWITAFERPPQGSRLFGWDGSKFSKFYDMKTDTCTLHADELHCCDLNVSSADTDDVIECFKFKDNKADQREHLVYLKNKEVQTEWLQTPGNLLISPDGSVAFMTFDRLLMASFDMCTGDVLAVWYGQGTTEYPYLQGMDFAESS